MNHKKIFIFIVLSLLLKNLTVHAVLENDTTFYPYPAPISLPHALTTGLDPIFKTPIMRLTDEKDGALHCGNVYSYYGSFNKDSTYVMAGCLGIIPNEGIVPSTIIYGWDGAKFKTTSKKILTTLNTTPSLDIVNHGIWSGTKSNIIFVEDGYKIYSYNIATDKIIIIKDFTSIFPNQYIWQMHRSMDDNRFSFSIRNKDDYTYEGYAVWEKSTDSLIYEEHNINKLDEVQIDKSGKYLKIEYGNSINPEGASVDLKTGIKTKYNDISPEYNLGHSDNGDGVEVGEENWLGHIWKRDLSKGKDLLTSGIKLFPTLGGWDSSAKMGNTGIGGHFSMLTDDEKWLTISNAIMSGTPKRFEGQIYQVSTDGTEKIRRIAFTQSIHTNDYYDFPRANISRDGDFIAFTSNWGVSGGRRDMYIASLYDFNHTTFNKTTPDKITTLRVGSQGDMVKELQNFLNKALNISLKIDGRFGLKTKNAVKEWQKNVGLTADGIVGKNSQAKMKNITL